MGSLRILSWLLRTVGFLLRAAVAVVVTVVGWLFVGDMVSAGRLPAEPLGLAALGLPATLLGIPTAYAGGILLFVGLLLFGEGGSGSSTVGGGFDADADGGFGGGGDGDGGGGGGGGDGE